MRSGCSENTEYQTSAGVLQRLTVKAPTSIYCKKLNKPTNAYLIRNTDICTSLSVCCDLWPSTFLFLVNQTPLRWTGKRHPQKSKSRAVNAAPSGGRALIWVKGGHYFKIWKILHLLSRVQPLPISFRDTGQMSTCQWNGSQLITPTRRILGPSSSPFDLLSCVRRQWSWDRLS